MSMYVPDISVIHSMLDSMSSVSSTDCDVVTDSDGFCRVDLLDGELPGSFLVTTSFLLLLSFECLVAVSAFHLPR